MCLQCTIVIIVHTKKYHNITLHAYVVHCTILYVYCIRVGLAGGNALENAELFEIVELCEDIWTRIHAMFWLKDEAVKELVKKIFKEQFLPLTMAALEKRITLNDCPDGWIYGSKVGKERGEDGAGKQNKDTVESCLMTIPELRTFTI